MAADTGIPLVSVLMTSYNRERYIGEAIESVLASSWKDFELIICDDASKDQTVAIAKTYAEKDSRIHIHVNETNLGDYRNRNKIASLARGTYIKYLDSDDQIYPWGLEAMVRCMEAFPEAGFGLMSNGLPMPAMYPILVQPLEAYRIFFFKNTLSSMGPSGSIIRRDAFMEVEGFSGKPYVGDSEMWMKMARKFALVRMPLDLIWWREHEGQQFLEGHKNNYYATHLFSLYREALSHPECPLPAAERTQALANMENSRIREIIGRYLLRRKWAQGFALLKSSGLNLFDFWKAFRKNQYPI